MSPRSWHLYVAVVLIALLAAVATLQYRWVGEVSAAERDRLRASLRARVSEFTVAVDRDVSRTFAAFQVDPASFERDPAGTLADAATGAAAWTATGAAVKAVFVAEPGRDGVLRRLDVQARSLETTSWPAELATVQARVGALSALAVPGLPLLPVFNDPIDRAVPALIVPVTAPVTPELDPTQSGLVVRRVEVEKPWHAVVVWLDATQLQSGLLAPLVDQQFGDQETSEFNVAVIDKRDRQPVYHSGPVVDLATADFTSDVFALRLDDLVWRRTGVPPRDGAGAETIPPDRMAITIFRREGRGAAADAQHLVRQGAAWTLAVQAKRGSLDAVVARSRTRNLALSLGVLAVLGAGLGLLLVASARAQRTARQQLEFVASVSHELRTPLAVMRSAGENLADGLVADTQVATYGALIRDEGRRLTNMVDRVMDFAGMSAGRSIGPARPTEILGAVESIVSAVGGQARGQGITIHVEHPAGPLTVMADPAALASALQNVIGNAVKYSTAGGDVDIELRQDHARVRIAVRDRGIGIDRRDLPHVFEPFFRGRRAVESQVRGSGVGLSVVKKIVDAIGGSVRIGTREGGGTEVHIDLPAAVAGAGTEDA